MKIFNQTNIFVLIVFNFVFSQNFVRADEPQEKAEELAAQDKPLQLAETMRDKVIKAEISDWEARLEYARLLSNMKRYDESLIQLRMLLAKKPNSASVQIEIAKVFYYQGKSEEALEMLEKIPDKDIDDKTRLLMADIYLSLHKYWKAESIYQNWLKKSPDDDHTKLKIAELLSWQKRYQESIELYRQILANRPDDIQIRRKYAMVLIWMGNEQKAAEELKKTLGPGKTNE